MVEIRWHGRGGQGSFTASKLLGEAASLYENKYALAFPAFGPERRGAPVLAFTKIDDKKIYDRSEVSLCDYMVFLDDTLVSESILKELKPGGKFIINSNHPEKYKEWKGADIVTIDATSIALEIIKRPITNTAMLGALIGVSGIVSIDSAIKSLESYLDKSIIAKNIEVMKRSYERSKESSI